MSADHSVSGIADLLAPFRGPDMDGDGAGQIVRVLEDRTA